MKVTVFTPEELVMVPFSACLGSKLHLGNIIVFFSFLDKIKKVIISSEEVKPNMHLYDDVECGQNRGNFSEGQCGSRVLG